MRKGLKIFFKVFIVSLLIGCLLIGGIFIAGCFGMFTTNSEFDISSFDLHLNTTIYYTDKNGAAQELDHLYGTQNRIWADISDIPEYLQEAVVSIEDERFYSHNGVDFLRSAKAFFTYVTRGSSTFGGSTITQQLVKNITDDRENKPERKIREMWSAMEVERKYSKEQILELYLNTMYLANGCNGVQAAANKYFNKDVSELTLAESASIAGITQYPSLYDPLVNPDKNIEKQKVVLKKMLELGKIDEEEYEEALAEDLDFQDKSINTGDNSQSYFVDMVINDTIKDLQKIKGYSWAYAEKLVYNGGLKIYATIDPDIQRAIEKIYKDPSNFPKVSGSTTPQSAMIILDPYTGAVKGTAGGIGNKQGDRVLNRSTQSYRQPGSTIKPIGVYAPAIERNIVSPGSMVLDAPIDINGWKPSNYYSGYKGNVTVRNAVEQSMNTPAVRVLEKVGVDYSFDFLTSKLGLELVSSAVRDGKGYSDKNLSSLALGGLTDGVSALQLAAAYAPFVNNGLYSKPYSYTKVVDNTGKTLLENHASTTIAMSEQTAFLTHTMLKSVVDNGTGQTAKLPCGMPSAGKTGTTDDQNDRWYVGYTPYYVGVVWYGYDQPKSLEFLSSHPCIPVWRKVMNEISKNMPIKDFAPQPSGISRAAICLESGNLATEFCESAEAKISNEYFKTSMLPSRKCEVHNTLIEPSPSPEVSQEPTEEPDASVTPQTSQPPREGSQTPVASQAPSASSAATPSRVPSAVPSLVPSSDPTPPPGI